ncbi:hypothetical protein, partial [Cupriavidus sp. IDO]|uniref:hypothetical protein n=1 Tax=Cupriavidus sp. IDO TaxID=1539142 RepID=UPI0023797089
AVHLDQERSRHLAESHSRQPPLKFQTEWNAALALLDDGELQTVRRRFRGKPLSSFLASGRLPPQFAVLRGADQRRLVARG